MLMLSETRKSTRQSSYRPNGSNSSEMDPAKTINDIKSIHTSGLNKSSNLSNSSYFEMKTKDPTEQKWKNDVLYESALASLLLEPSSTAAKKNKKIQAKEEKAKTDEKKSILISRILDRSKVHKKRKHSTELPAQVTKKHKTAADNSKTQSVSESVKSCVKDIPALFRIPPDTNFCLECGDLEEEELEVYKCSKCSKYFHSHCAAKSKGVWRPIRFLTGDAELIIDRWTVTLTCKSCDGKKPECFLCHGDQKFIYDCTVTNCTHAYHTSCLEKCPQSNLSNPKVTSKCPQHGCHTCLLKNRKLHKGAKVVKCIKCPAAYHIDGLCIPAGTKVLTDSLILCPRHKGPNETSEDIPHCDFCFNCLGSTSGEPVFKCKSCLKVIHLWCAEPSDFDSCNLCRNGDLPLYSTIIWLYIDNKWCPGKVLTPQESPDLEEHQNDRKFCVQVRHSGDFIWTTCDKVMKDSEVMQELFKPLSEYTSTSPELKTPRKKPPNHSELPSPVIKKSNLRNNRRSTYIDLNSEKDASNKEMKATRSEIAGVHKLSSPDPIGKMIVSLELTHGGN